jgi:hypothetical protein
MNARSVLFNFVLTRIESEPVATRADLYDALAEIAGRRDEVAKLRSLASDLRQANRRCQEFAFTFHQQDGQ